MHLGKGVVVDLYKFLNSSLFACGLVGLLMLFVATLAFLRNRQMVKERAGIFIIAAVLLLVLVALSVNGPQ
jgi:hypothetical protein